MKYRSLVLVAAMLALVACSSKEKKAQKPAELVDIQNPTVRVQKLWGASVGGGGKKLRLGLGLAAMDGRLFAAGRDGDVAAYDLRTGKPIWRVDTKLELAGGTGAGHGHVAVGSADGHVVLLSAEDGSEKWRSNVKGEVLSAPAIAPTAVIVRTVDG
jgi:outer membrane protein assembly factor BamB